MTLGDIIATYRKEHDNMSMDNFSSLSGISKAYISMLERNQTQRGDEPTPSITTYRKVANAMGVAVDDLLRMVDGKVSIAGVGIPSNSIPAEGIAYRSTGMAPVVGTIPAGVPVLAIQNIESYEPVDVADPENVFWLRVSGESMSGAGIHSGDLALIRMQPCAENGQIVACRVNGDEATLKRFKQQGDMVILLPENSDFEPRIISLKEFETGEAEIIGVLLEIKRKY